MTSTDDAGKRFWSGPKALGSLVPAITRPAFRKRAPAAAQLLADWPSLVGPSLAGVTEPRKLAGGTLTIATSGPMAIELQHLAPQLIARLNGQLGRVVVERIRLIQDAPVCAAAPAPPTRTPALAAARAAVDGLPDGPLRDALESLGRQVLSAS